MENSRGEGESSAVDGTSDSKSDGMYPVPTSHDDSVGTRYIVSADQTPVPATPVTDAAGRQVLRDEIDALVAHLYGLSRDEFAHILGTFPLVFPDNTAGQAKKARLLAVYDEWAATVKDWARG